MIKAYDIDKAGMIAVAHMASLVNMLALVTQIKNSLS
jgi:hypothetical protein